MVMAKPVELGTKKTSSLSAVTLRPPPSDVVFSQRQPKPGERKAGRDKLKYIAKLTAVCFFDPWWCVKEGVIEGAHKYLISKHAFGTLKFDKDYGPRHRWWPRQ